MTGAGILNRRVVIEMPQSGTGPIGEPLEGWATFKECWGSYKAPTGMGVAKQSEPDSSGVGRSIVRCSWRINYTTGVTVDMRLRYKDEIFDIKTVLPDFDRRAYTDLVCTRGGSDG